MASDNGESEERADSPDREPEIDPEAQAEVDEAFAPVGGGNPIEVTLFDNADLGIQPKDEDTLHLTMGVNAAVIVYQSEDNTGMRGKKYILPLAKSTIPGLIEMLKAAYEDMGGPVIAEGQDPQAAQAVAQAREKHQRPRRKKRARKK